LAALAIMVVSLGAKARDCLRMKVLFLSTYDLGHSPFGLASPAAWLYEAGASIGCNDLAVEPLDEGMVREAGLIAIHVPMHTATRLAGVLAPRLRALNPVAHLCFYGLYAPLNEDYLRGLGAGTILGGEFESGLARLYTQLVANGSDNGVDKPDARCEPVISLVKQRFRVPRRGALPPLSRYARLELANGERLLVGYTEASRGCKHLCRHCPVVPVYGGAFRVVQREIVLDDIRNQVALGARHITFGDPDFFNGVGHALPLVRAMHEEFPGLTYDVTIKVEHLLRHAGHLPMLVETGCLFVTTAVESTDDRVLERLAKGHSRADFLRAVMLAREAGLALAPTFIPFTPWTTPESYLDLLGLLAELDLVESVAPVQLALRLLIPKGSRLYDLPEMKGFLEEFDAAALTYRWSHPDPRVEQLYEGARRIVEAGEAGGEERQAVFEGLWRLAREAGDMPPARPPSPLRVTAGGGSAARTPRFDEPWFCCAEPTPGQLARI
jgi:radical SAM superfamily enzyme YgiQ (UPF0313 family)